MDYRHVLQRDTVLDGKYRIERVIGAGGFGITYEALDQGLDTHVAVKEYYPADIAMRDTTLTVRPSNNQDRPLFEHLRSSFLREARTLAQFNHPSIVGVLNVFEWHGTAYMVMQLETGPSLKSWLADLGRPASQAELDAIAAPVLNALEVMHRAEFLHRDIAPDNIIIRADGSPVVLDFGASRRVMGAGQVALTGIVKRGYSPPEQYAGESRSQGPWTDIYATAATLYLAVTGTPPLDATERMLEDHMPTAAALSRSPGQRPSFPAAIDWGLKLRPQERPQTIAAWRDAMFGSGDDAAQAGASRLDAGTSTRKSSTAGAPRSSEIAQPVDLGERRPSAPLRPSSRPSVPSLPTPPQPSAAQAPPGRHRRLALLASLVLLATVAVGGMLAFALGLVGERAPRLATASNTSAPLGTARAQDPPTAVPAAPTDAERAARDLAAAREREAAVTRQREDAARKSAEQRTASAAPIVVPQPPPAAEAQAVLVARIRRELNRVGCRTDATTSAWVDADQKALERFARYAGGNISFAALNSEVVDTVGSFVGRVCPSECGSGEKPEVARCIAAGAAAPAEVPLCSQINERAQLGTLSEDDRQRLQSGRCR